jgi:hypothetical protein
MLMIIDSYIIASLKIKHTFKITDMKVEFELNLDDNGRPCIKFRHHDKDNSLEQKALKVFLDAVKEKGCELRNPTGYLCSSEGKSWENYEIQIAK